MQYPAFPVIAGFLGNILAQRSGFFPGKLLAMPMAYIAVRGAGAYNRGVHGAFRSREKGRFSATAFSAFCILFLPDEVKAGQRRKGSFMAATVRQPAQ